jgi:hypothetical protein
MMAKKFSAEYTVGDILGLYETRKNDGDEARLRTLANQFRSLTRLESKVIIPEQYKAISREVRTPFVRDAWHRITSSLVAKPPVCHITPKDEDRQDYREAANTAERFDMAQIERINKERGTDIVYNLTAGLVRDGESVLRVVHRPSAWANFPKRITDEEGNVEKPDDYTQRTAEYKRGADLPIAWKDVDRLSVVCEGGEYGDEWVCEFGEYAKPYLKSRYAMQQGDNGLLINPHTKLEGKPMPEGLQTSSSGRTVKVEFVTSREWHVIIDGNEAPGWPKKNPYAPHLGYFRASAYDMESLLYSLLFLVPRLDELLTMKLNWSVLGAYPTPVIRRVPNASGLPQLDGPLGNPGDATSNKSAVLTWTPGKAMDLAPGEEMDFLAPPPVGADLNELVVIFKSMIDIAGIPSIMRGVSGAGDSGYLANQMRAAAEMSYKLAMLALQRQLEKATEFSHWLVPSVIKQTIYVLGWDSINPKTGRPTTNAGKAWLGLSPDHQTKNVADVSKLGPVSFQYRPTLPTDEQARAMIAMQLTNAAKPLYDVRHALETWMQEEDPDSIIDAMVVEQALAEEPLHSMWVNQALTDAGLLPAPQPQPNPAAQLVDQFGQPMLPPGPGQLQGVPLANQAPPGMAGIPYLTMPGQPTPPGAPAGIPGNVGGRPAGVYPGMPGGPNG